MAATPRIQSFQKVVPMIYAYTTPGVIYHDGWTKIGYTERQSVEERIKQQTHTAHIKWELAWQANAMYNDGTQEYFTDHDFHRYLEQKLHIPREKNTEWFQIDGDASQRYFFDFTMRKGLTSEIEEKDYVLRDEQARAVAQTKAYFEKGGTEFLWNAKPRFGKTLTTYDLMRSMNLKKVLVVTNRPSIANSWLADFRSFIEWRGNHLFVSETDALKDKDGVYSRDAFITKQMDNEDLGMVAFESLQGIKGSRYFGGDYDKLQWIADNEFDMLVIDESHEGVDTIKTEHAFNNIRRKYTLYLSGTPFKALANAKFGADQVFNWSYADEQAAKQSWQSEESNPYGRLPRLALYTYRMSDMITDTVTAGKPMMDDEDLMAYAFDLSEFFATDGKGTFIHEQDVRTFLHRLTTNEKYPFSTPELRQELRHTLWMLNYVDSAKAMAKLLKDKEFASVFGEYEIVLAAGDGKIDDVEVDDKAFDRVTKAIKNHEKTITLSVGQLTVGVTIPAWSGVLMLCNLKSPSSYMQAAFRAQNPYEYRDPKDNKLYIKDTAYVFDFDPVRTLMIYDQFANDLVPLMSGGHGTDADRADNIKQLINFFPVIAEDDAGRMIELDAAKVLSIPRKLKCDDVVRRGFMSNYLFQNIGRVFGASGVIKTILEKLKPATEGKKRDIESLPTGEHLHVNDEGEVDIPEEIVIGQAKNVFGYKEYADVVTAVRETYTPSLTNLEEKVAKVPVTVSAKKHLETITKHVEDFVKDVTVTTKSHVIQKVLSTSELSDKEKKRLTKQMSKEIEREIERKTEDARLNYKTAIERATAVKESATKSATTDQDVETAEEIYEEAMRASTERMTAALARITSEIAREKPKEVIETIARYQEEQEKRSIEEKFRSNLRGFSRTIPSFIMAYADACPDKELTLANFDDFTDDDVFKEVTGITEEEFRLLRDGGTTINPDTGEEETFKGGLFDEIVFNDSIKAFLKKKDELANYFDTKQTEDIFDYIPPQKTNQIFTPRWVVEKMVDDLEANNPGCFDNPDYTFADLYMKSGLYITEIVKRLYRSEGLRTAFPNEKERIRHIFTKQVYGMAPTEIIYLIATNYILGFDKELKRELTEGHKVHFVKADAAEASKAGKLSELVDTYFG